MHTSIPQKDRGSSCRPEGYAPWVEGCQRIKWWNGGGWGGLSGGGDLIERPHPGPALAGSAGPGTGGGLAHGQGGAGPGAGVGGGGGAELFWQGDPAALRAVGDVALAADEGLERVVAGLAEVFVDRHRRWLLRPAP